MKVKQLMSVLVLMGMFSSQAYSLPSNLAEAKKSAKILKATAVKTSTFTRAVLADYRASLNESDAQAEDSFDKATRAADRAATAAEEMNDAVDNFDFEEALLQLRRGCARLSTAKLHLGNVRTFSDAGFFQDVLDDVLDMRDAIEDGQVAAFCNI